MAVPQVHYFTASDPIGAAELNANADVLTYVIKDRPFAVVNRKSTTQALADNAKVSFDFVLEDNANMVDLATNPTRVTIREDGIYSIEASVPYTDNNSAPVNGNRVIRILKNGVETAAQTQPRLSGDIAGGTKTTKYLVVGDYLEIQVGHDMTINMVTRVANDGPTLSVLWLCE